MAALALLFAVHSYQPSPFFVLDEVDAALDNVNVTKIAKYIREHAGPGMQFIVISLKTGLFQGSETLVGIYRDQGANSSKALTLDVRFFFWSFFFFYTPIRLHHDRALSLSPLPSHSHTHAPFHQSIPIIIIGKSANPQLAPKIPMKPAFTPFLTSQTPPLNWLNNISPPPPNPLAQLPKYQNPIFRLFLFLFFFFPIRTLFRLSFLPRYPRSESRPSGSLV